MECASASGTEGRGFESGHAHFCAGLFSEGRTFRGVKKTKRLIGLEKRTDGGASNVTVVQIAHARILEHIGVHRLKEI